MKKMGLDSEDIKKTLNEMNTEGTSYLDMLKKVMGADTITLNVEHGADHE